jgi:hypothetical protein
MESALARPPSTARRAGDGATAAAAALLLARADDRMNEHPADPASPTPPAASNRVPFSPWWPLACGAAAGLLLRFAFSGHAGGAYAAMLDSFIYGSPALVGAVTVYVAELEKRRSWSYYFIAPAIATFLYVLGSLVILIEGWICAILIFPMFTLIGGLTGLVMGAICRITNWPRPAIVSSFAILPLITGAFEHRIPLTAYERVQEREVFVAAAPAEVWRQLIDARAIRPDEVGDAWMYRIGVPLPLSGAGDSREGEHLRHITMGKGIHFDQVATEWRPGEAVTWGYRFSPDSFPAGALDDHVRIGGRYFDLGATRYTLRASRHGTWLKLRMQYRVSTSFNWYAGPVADLLVGNFADVILRFYAGRAVQPAPAPDQSS